MPLIRKFNVSYKWNKSFFSLSLLGMILCLVVTSWTDCIRMLCVSFWFVCCTFQKLNDWLRWIISVPVFSFSSLEIDMFYVTTEMWVCFLQKYKRYLLLKKEVFLLLCLFAYAPSRTHIRQMLATPMTIAEASVDRSAALWWSRNVSRVIIQLIIVSKHLRFRAI